MTENQPMDNEAYHADTTRISKSGLDLIAKSPSHYYDRYLHPNRPPRESQEHFAFGSLFHTAVLEENLIHDEFLVLPEAAPPYPSATQWKAANPSADTVKAIKFWKAIEESKGSRQIIDRVQYEEVMRMKESLFKHPAARMLIEMEGIVEQAVFFEEPTTGALCKIKPDKRVPQHGIVIDLKSTQDASREGFGKSSYNHRYYVQDPFYVDGLNFAKAEGVEWKEFFFVAVEKTWPWKVAVYQLHDHARRLGREEYQHNCRTYVAARESGIWEAYGDTVELLDIPAWAYRRNS